MATTAPPYGPPYSGTPYARENEQISELPSPLPTSALPARPDDRPPLSQSELWFPGAMMTGAVGGTAEVRQVEQQPPVEMPGDTDINQHHPAMSPKMSPIGPEDQQQPSTMSPVSPEEPNHQPTNVGAVPVTPFLKGGIEGQEAQSRTVGRARSRVSSIEGADRGNEPGREAAPF